MKVDLTEQEIGFIRRKIEQEQEMVDQYRLLSDIQKLNLHRALIVLLEKLTIQPEKPKKQKRGTSGKMRKLPVSPKCRTGQRGSGRRRHD